jgi:hypothetical protein
VLVGSNVSDRQLDPLSLCPLVNSSGRQSEVCELFPRNVNSGELHLGNEEGLEIAREYEVPRRGYGVAEFEKHIPGHSGKGRGQFAQIPLSLRGSGTFVIFTDGSVRLSPRSALVVIRLL